MKNITKEIKLHLLCHYHDNSLATGPVLHVIMTKISIFVLAKDNKGS